MVSTRILTSKQLQKSRSQGNPQQTGSTLTSIKNILYKSAQGELGEGSSCNIEFLRCRLSFRLWRLQYSASYLELGTCFRRSNCYQIVCPRTKMDARRYTTPTGLSERPARMMGETDCCRSDNWSVSSSRPNSRPPASSSPSPTRGWTKTDESAAR